MERDRLSSDGAPLTRKGSPPTGIIVPATTAMHAAAEDVLDKQSRLNRSTRGQWHLYASHRQAIERLLVPAAPGGRLCVLGAGNCNDLDLRYLTQAYREVRLVDLDASALERAAAFQQVERSPALHRHAPVDLTGIGECVSAWARQSPTPDEVAACTRAAAQPPAPPLLAQLGGSFDVVLSPCVLSQLLTPARDTITENHPGFDALLTSLRSHHFQLMTTLLAPGGRGVFVCDVLSSKSVPDLARVPRHELVGLMRRRIAAGRYFTGIDPNSIASVLATDGRVAPHIADVRAAEPWVWHLALSKSFLVYAMTFRRRAGVGQ